MPAPPPRCPTLAEDFANLPPARPVGSAATARLMLVGCLVLAVFGARPLREFMERQAETPSWVQAALDGWDAALTRVGLAEPHPAIRDAVTRAKQPPL